MERENIVFYIINLYWVIIYIIIQKVSNKKVMVYSIISFITMIVTIKIMNNYERYFIPNEMGFLLNYLHSLEVFLGILSILMTIYIYSISLGDDFKKSILLILLGKGRIIYLGMMVLILYYFDVKPFYFFSLIIFLFLELYNMTEATFFIVNTTYFRKNWKNKIIPRLVNQGKRNDLENIYYELRKRITKAMLEKDFIVFEEMLAYYKDLLMTDGFEVPEDFIKKRIEKYKNQEEDSEEKEKAVGFLYEIYIYLLENRDDNLFDKIENLNIELAEYYLEKEDYRLAREYYSFLNLKYDYLNKKYKDDIKEKGFHLFTGLRYYHSSIKNLTEQKEIVILKSILDLFYKLIKEKKYDELEEYRLILTKKDSFLEIYARVIIFHFLIYLDKNNNGIERIINFFKIDILKLVRYNLEIIKYLYNLSKENHWEKEFRNIGLNYFKVDILGRASRECSYDFDKTLLTLADKKNWRLS